MRQEVNFLEYRSMREKGTRNAYLEQRSYDSLRGRLLARPLQRACLCRWLKGSYLTDRSRADISSVEELNEEELNANLLRTPSANETRSFRAEDLIYINTSQDQCAVIRLRRSLASLSEQEVTYEVKEIVSGIHPVKACKSMLESDPGKSHPPLTFIQPFSNSAKPSPSIGRPASLSALLSEARIRTPTELPSLSLGREESMVTVRQAPLKWRRRVWTLLGDAIGKGRTEEDCGWRIGARRSWRAKKAAQHHFRSYHRRCVGIERPT